MDAIAWANKYVVFEKSSPVTGAFNLHKYPFLASPLRALDDISKKQIVVYKASSALGTVFLQIATAYRLDRRPGDMLIVAQSDDDANDFSKTRVRPFVERLEPLMSMLKKDKYAITNDMLQWPHQFAIISGPGVNSQNSKQVRYVHTDESHLWKSGALAAFEKRMGGRWDRSGLHVSTAADEGADIDALYHEGAQNEWHHRCPSCNELVWLQWREASKKHYGAEVFRWRECEDERQSLDSITLVCPHCKAEHADTPRSRFALCEHGDYIPMNPAHEPAKESFRWNVFAAHWIAWRDILAEHFQAMKAARIGDLSKHADFVKKRECRSYVPEIPDLGESVEGRDYRLADVWGIEDTVRIAAFDVQDAGGLHFWGQVDEFARDGSSRRVAFARLSSWEACREFAVSHGVHPHNTFVDYGFRDREVFARCAEWEWYALASTDDSEYTHYRTLPDKTKMGFTRPYSPTQEQDSMSGRKKLEIVRARANALPAGFCYSRLWSKPVLAGILYRLKAGKSISGRYYGIALDISGDYVSQLHSYVPTTTRNKITGGLKMFWKKCKKDDHSFATSSMCLVGAMVSGHFPMDFAIPTAPQAPETEIDLAESAA